MTIKQYDVKALTESSYATWHHDPKDTWNSPSINISRSYKSDEDVSKLWTFYISHSSSSSSDKNVDGLLKVSLLALQLVDCVDTMRDMMNNVHAFEDAYQARRATERAEYAAAQAAKQAKIEADTKLTPSAIGHLIATMCVDIKHGGAFRIVKELRERGSDNTHRLIARATSGGAVQFKLSGVLYSKKDLATRLEAYAAIIDVKVEA